MCYGFFDDSRREYVISQPDTPLPWINYLGTEGFFGLISNTAGGYSFYRDARLRRLTRYRHWQGPNGETIDGTNNGCERAIGWWVKERYRTMRGYKRPKSAVNVSRLLAWCGNHLERGGADLALLVA